MGTISGYPFRYGTSDGSLAATDCRPVEPRPVLHWEGVVPGVGAPAGRGSSVGAVPGPALGPRPVPGAAKPRGLEHLPARRRRPFRRAAAGGEVRPVRGPRVRDAGDLLL